MTCILFECKIGTKRSNCKLMKEIITFGWHYTKNQNITWTLFHSKNVLMFHLPMPVPEGEVYAIPTRLGASSEGLRCKVMSSLKPDFCNSHAGRDACTNGEELLSEVDRILILYNPLRFNVSCETTGKIIRKLLK